MVRGEFAVFTFSDLVQYQRKGFRNGNWRRLSLLDKAYFRVSICYAKARGKIVNSRVVDNLKSIMEKLTLTFYKKVFIGGLEKSQQLLLKFEEKGVFNWALEFKGWLKDPKYIFWLGLFPRDGGFDP
jgi:hypothetical protein